MVGTLSGATTDAIGAVDGLGFRPYIHALADLVTSPHTQPPVTIGIYGSSGAGKSFLLEHLEREVIHRQYSATVAEDGAPRIYVVRFNAWEASKSEIVWLPLIRRVLLHLDRLPTWPRHTRLWARARWNAARQLHQARGQLIVGSVVLTGAIATAVSKGESIVAAAIVGVAGAFGVSGVLKPRTVDMESLKFDLELLEQRLHPHRDPWGPPTGRLLVVIDDLDRLEPAKSIELLQAIELLLNFETFVVCLAIDPRRTSYAIEKHLGAMFGGTDDSGYDYLAKMVQIPFRVPKPNVQDVIAFIADQLGHPVGPVDEEFAPSDGGLQAERSSPTVERARDREVPFTYAEQKAFELFAAYLRPNPRHIKRLLNLYRVTRALASTTDESLIYERLPATIRWLLMWSQWPYASRAMLERYQELRALHGADLADRVAQDDPMLYLLGDVERSWDSAVHHLLDDRLEELHELLSIPGCGLTWDEIGRIRRVTANLSPAV